MRAYYFSNLDKKLRYDDNRLIEVGITHEVKFPYVYNGETFEKPTICEAGLHGSVRAIDALKYAAGEFLWIVDIEGDIKVGDDKICGSRRTYLVGFDAIELLRKFSKKVALINIEKIKPYTSKEDYDIILRFLNGDENLRSAARTAAESAAESAKYAARTAAWYAARPAAWYAAESAAESAAAWTAAESAAESAAAESARYAARYAAEYAWYAAGYAAWTAAQYAAYNNMNKILEEMIEEELIRM